MEWKAINLDVLHLIFWVPQQRGWTMPGIHGQELAPFQWTSAERGYLTNPVWKNKQTIQANHSNWGTGHLKPVVMVTLKEVVSAEGCSGAKPHAFHWRLQRWTSEKGTEMMSSSVSLMLGMESLVIVEQKAWKISRCRSALQTHLGHTALLRPILRNWLWASRGRGGRVSILCYCVMFSKLCSSICLSSVDWKVQQPLQFSPDTTGSFISAPCPKGFGICHAKGSLWSIQLERRMQDLFLHEGKKRVENAAPGCSLSASMAPRLHRSTPHSHETLLQPGAAALSLIRYWLSRRTIALGILFGQIMIDIVIEQLYNTKHI